MRYLSVCSGIEAASRAWCQLGWSAVAFSEIEKFPCAYLEATYPAPNLGDMTRFADWPALEMDVLVGGTPCQAFSVAGQRRSLDDERGNLTLVFCRIADRFDPEIIVWENVPGVLSTPDNAFGCFLAELAGCDTPIDPGRVGWTHAGVVAGPKRTVAWRVIDSQGFVPQRRSRVFVVAARAGSRVHPADVLFETEAEAFGCLGERAYTGPLFPLREGMRGDTAAGGEAGKDVAPSLAARTRGGGGLGTDAELDGALVAAYGGNNMSGPIDVATARNAHGGPHGRLDVESETFIVGSLCASGKAAGSATQQDAEGGMLVFSCKDHGADVGEIAPTLRAMPHDGSHANAGGQIAVAYGIRSDAARDGEAKTPSTDAAGKVRLRAPGFNVYEEYAPTLDAGAPHTVAFNARQDPDFWTERTGPLDVDPMTQAVALRGIEGGSTAELSDIPSSLRASQGGGDKAHVMTGMVVRRLTPLECERLMGQPDNATLIEYRGKPAADGPRYKALGNSKVVDVVLWIGQRIEKLCGDIDGEAK